MASIFGSSSVASSRSAARRLCATVVGLASVAVLGTVSGARVKVDNMACAAVSFPGFTETLRSIASGRKGRSP